MKKTISIVTLALLTGMTASAAIIVDFDPGPTGTNDSPVADIQTLNGDTWTFRDAGDALGPLAAIATSPQNGTFYGGAITTWATSADYDPLFRNVNGAYQLRMANGADTYTFKGVYLWNKADYLVGAGSAAVLGAGSSMSYNFSGFANDSSVISKEMRAVVNQGGTYYISENKATSNGGALDIGASQWAVLTTSDYSYNTNAYSVLTLDDVRGVGLYFQGSRTGAAAGNNLADFQVNAIPEPTTLGLIVFTSFGLLAARRLRNI